VTTTKTPQDANEGTIGAVASTAGLGVPTTCRDAFVAMVRDENFYREAWSRWSLKAHWTGAVGGFADEMLQKRWKDFQAGWCACTPNAKVSGGGTPSAGLPGSTTAPTKDRTEMPKCGGREYCTRMPFCGCGGPTEEEIDEDALERFTKAMRVKLAASRAKGRHGWHNPDVCSVEDLARMFFDHVAKGDLVDIANFAMFLHQRKGRPETWRLTHPDTWGEGSNVELTGAARHERE